MEMEFTKAQVAALVLGYLRSEKLYSVVDEFTKCCSHFEDMKNSKYFVTRVRGKSLTDFLKQYEEIHYIVQARLEETNYFETHSGSGATLVDQLQYLLDQKLVNFAASTPVWSVSMEVEATPAHTLPNTYEVMCTAPLENPPSKKSHPCDTVLALNLEEASKSTDESTNKTHSTNLADPIDDHNRAAIRSILVAEVLVQTLLQNHELHEKIAETINIVRSERAENVSDGHFSATEIKGKKRKLSEDDTSFEKN